MSSSDFPQHVLRNRDVWTGYASEYADWAPRAWAQLDLGRFEGRLESFEVNAGQLQANRRYIGHRNALFEDSERASR